MFANLPNDGRQSDYALEVTDAEREAIVAAIKDADGRKSEVKLARKAVGIEYKND